MRKEYDFAGARRGPVVPAAKGKTRITIYLDDKNCKAPDISTSRRFDYTGQQAYQLCK